jgi:hypothetical protein
MKFEKYLTEMESDDPKREYNQQPIEPGPVKGDRGKSREKKIKELEDSIKDWEDKIKIWKKKIQELKAKK